MVEKYLDLTLVPFAFNLLFLVSLRISLTYKTLICSRPSFRPRTRFYGEWEINGRKRMPVTLHLNIYCTLTGFQPGLKTVHL